MWRARWVAAAAWLIARAGTVYGGASYTFGALCEIELRGGTYNVLAQPDWNYNVPEWFASLALVFWRY